MTHAAPAHHFATLTALMSELAAAGFDKLSAALEKELEKGPARARPGFVYVQFAQQNRNLFLLMSDPSRLDSSNPALAQARHRGLRALAGDAMTSLEHPSFEQIVDMSAKWSFLHGLAVLLMTGRLTALLDISPQKTTEADLVAATLGYMRQKLTRINH